MKAVRLLKIPPVQNPTLSVMEDIVREEKPPYQLTEKNAFLASARKIIQAIREMGWSVRNRRACCMAPGTL